MSVCGIESSKYYSESVPVLIWYITLFFKSKTFWRKENKNKTQKWAIEALQGESLCSSVPGVEAGISF